MHVFLVRNVIVFIEVYNHLFEYFITEIIV